MLSSSFMFFSALLPALPAGNCFTCLEERCQNLIKIFSDDIPRYERDLKDKFQECSGTHVPTENCSVCLDQSNVMVYCPDDIINIEAEDNTSKPLDLEKCMYQTLISYRFWSYAGFTDITFVFSFV